MSSGPYLAALPPAKTTLAFRAYVAALRADPVLIAQEVVIWAWEGVRLQSKTGNAFQFTPSPDEVKNGLIRITPGTIPGKRCDETSQIIKFPFDMEVWTPGVHADDSMNLCDAVYLASKTPATVALMNAVDGVVGRWAMTNAGGEEKPIGESKFALLRKMTLEFHMQY